MKTDFVVKNRYVSPQSETLMIIPESVLCQSTDVEKGVSAEDATWRELEW